MGSMNASPISADAPPLSGQIEIPSKVAEIPGIALDVLRARWRSEFRRDPPKGLTRDLLVRTLAWRLQEILEGTQPIDLNLDRLVNLSLPIDWAEQRSVLGFK